MTINEENINEIIRRYNSVPIYFRNLIEEKERLKSNECKHYDREEFVSALKLDITTDNIHSLTDEDLKALEIKIEEEWKERRMRGI